MGWCGHAGSRLGTFLLGSLLLQAQADWVLPQEVTCPLGDLHARLEGVHRACCTQGGEQVCTSGGAPGPCSVDCAATFVPFYSDCDKVLAAFFDFDDDVWDNKAKAISGLNDRCLDIDQDLVTDAIDQMNLAGCEVPTDGISADTDGKSGRRLQIGYAGKDVCSLADFDPRLDEVNTACCADKEENCNAGVPTSCDYECAVEWERFVTDCSRIIGMMMPDNLDDFAIVTQTCHALPRAPLISAIVEAISSNCDCSVPDTLATTQALQCNPASLGPHVMEGIPSWPTLETESTCPMSEFAGRLAIVNAACCEDGGCGKGGPASCSLKCAVEVVPWYGLCRQTIDKNFDHADGIDDGTADGFAELVRKCNRIDLSIPETRLKTLINDERCDVNTIAIFAPVGQSNSGGISVPPPPPRNGGGHRRLKRRQAQLSQMYQTSAIVNHCSLPEIEDRIAAVDRACCDPNDSSDVCKDAGPPESCDFECSGVWLPLWNDCQVFLETIFESRAGVAEQFDALASACEALPPPHDFRPSAHALGLDINLR